jgi:hypothetical protein
MPAHDCRPMTMASPLRGTESAEGGGCAAADLLARRAGYGAAPPASRVLRIALRATALWAALTPETCQPSGPDGEGQATGQALGRVRHTSAISCPIRHKVVPLDNGPAPFVAQRIDTHMISSQTSTLCLHNQLTSGSRNGKLG